MLLLLSLLPALAGFPENASFDFSGMPYLSGANFVAVRTHSASLELEKGIVSAASTTVFKNGSNRKLTLTLVLPRGRVGDATSGMPAFMPAATWDRAPLKLAPQSSRGTSKPLEGKSFVYRSDLVARVGLNPGATHSLRVAYRLPEGRCGFEKKQRILGYAVENSRVGQFNLAFRSAGKSVFNLPKAHPDWEWQLGAKGAYIRIEPFEAQAQVAYFTYYPGGFDDIGELSKA